MSVSLYLSLSLSIFYLSLENFHWFITLVDWENEMESDHLSFKIVWDHFWFGIGANGYVKTCFWEDEISCISWF